MKKRLLFLFLVGLCVTFFSVTVLAASATIDTANIEKGIVVVKLTDFAGKTIKAQVEKGTDKYLYTLTTATVNLPLQMGTGDYKVTVFEGVGDNKFKPIATQAISAKSIDEKEMYKASIPIVDFGVSKTAIPAFGTLLKQQNVEKDKIDTAYKEMVTNYSYDFDKAATVKGDYVPVIDTIYSVKKGICYDYASVLAGALRSQGIPTKLVMGYVPEISVYHAWNEILINGKWVAVDSTYDAQVVKAGKAYTMEKDKSKNKTVKEY